ncbi:unnamed protein product [Echinostoma caproni]|uniref:Cytochrome P450 n=1 Tax=Echinostoma caproni TaxID=27848 RepID=A0A183A9K3_9TREM|nr:unnamed protein product [Echinostoma caproni]
MVSEGCPITDEQLSMKAKVDVLMGMQLVKKAWVSVHLRVLINSFPKPIFKPTLNQLIMQTPEDKCDPIENFNHYYSQFTLA